MKRVINFVLGITFMFSYVTVEIYPTVKLRTKDYLRNLDFNSLLHSKYLVEYSEHLSEEEKKELIEMITAYFNNTLH